MVKQSRSAKAIAKLHAIFYTIKYPSNYVFFPGEINERLANDMRDTIQQNYCDTTIPYHGKRFLHPRGLRKMVLRSLESDGIFKGDNHNNKMERFNGEVRDREKSNERTKETGYKNLGGISNLS